MKASKIVLKDSSKCIQCKWSTYTGSKYFCILPRCIPNLEDYSGVDANGKTKKIQQK